MTAITHPISIPTPSSAAPVLTLRRRTIDSVLVSLGAVVALVLVAAGGLLTWGANFSNDYVHDELTSQHIAFPASAALTTEGRTDLLSHAGASVDTGTEAEAYASYINGHLQAVAGGKTYADLGTPERTATAALTQAQTSGAPAAEVASLKAASDKITGQRNTLFKGETLRGLLLSAFAWATIGRIAGIAAYVAFGAAALMALLVALGARHHHKVMTAER
jgi:hypothetical protein